MFTELVVQNLAIIEITHLSAYSASTDWRPCPITHVVRKINLSSHRLLISFTTSASIRHLTKHAVTLMRIYYEFWEIVGELVTCILNNCIRIACAVARRLIMRPFPSIPLDRGPTLGVSKSTKFVFLNRRFETSM